MPGRLRLRRRIFWPYCGWGWHQPFYGPYGPPPPPQWGMERPTVEDEKEYLKEQIEILKEELKAIEERLKELEKTE